MNANTMSKRAQKLYAAVPAWPKKAPKFFRAWLMDRIKEDYERREIMTGTPAAIVRAIVCRSANQRCTHA